ncbi:hypothetical protein BG74_08230 [Sodalis-like endosymbiont of Proechinophthirus fluctus]|nr:hypothetical protein BG74_08230 [Sodalis-like endosymbiont of Proechinophthirus fluctus]
MDNEKTLYHVRSGYQQVPVVQTANEHYWAALVRTKSARYPPAQHRLRRGNDTALIYFSSS